MNSSSTETHKVGRRIRAREVLVIDNQGVKIGVMQLHEALQRADDEALQLVEINPKSTPPVCKIMDYGRFKYETAKSKRAHNQASEAAETKEIKLGPKTQGHDLSVKARQIKGFLEDGSKVRLAVRFRGREIAHPETGTAVLARLLQEIGEAATVIQPSQMEGKNMCMTLGPRRKP